MFCLLCVDREDFLVYFILKNKTNKQKISFNQFLFIYYREVYIWAPLIVSHLLHNDLLLPYSLNFQYRNIFYLVTGYLEV